MSSRSRRQPTAAKCSSCEIARVIRIKPRVAPFSHEEATDANLISEKGAVSVLRSSCFSRDSPDRSASDEASGSVVVAVYKPGHAPSEESTEAPKLNVCTPRAGSFKLAVVRRCSRMKRRKWQPLRAAREPESPRQSWSISTNCVCRNSRRALRSFARAKLLQLLLAQAQLLLRILALQRRQAAATTAAMQTRRVSLGASVRAR